jgi:hypothetical protein
MNNDILMRISPDQADRMLRLKSNSFDIGKQNTHISIDKSYPLDLGNHKINHLLFADDLLLLSENKEGLQHCLNKLNSYCITWRLQIILTETKIMIFSKGKNYYSKYHFFQNNSQIEIVERYNYLGIVFYFNGNLKHAADDLYNKALKAFFSVKSKFNNFQEVPLKTCLKLFDSLLKAILAYGCQIIT